MAEPGDRIFVVMMPAGNHYEPQSYHAKSQAAQAKVYEAYPDTLRQNLFWVQDGFVCRLRCNAPFPHPLPYVATRELT